MSYQDVLDRIKGAERKERFIRLSDQFEARACAVEASHGRDARIAQITRYATDQFTQEGNVHFIRGLAQMDRTPATIDEFIESKEFLGGLVEIWPALRPELRSLCPDVMLGETPVHEALLGGATGTGKTATCNAIISYQDYLLSCFKTPQLLYGLSPMTPIVFMFQSVSHTITKRVIYRPLRTLITSMPYTKRWRKWDKHVEAVLRFDNGVEHVPALANLDAILGQAVVGCMLDEVNFMKVIENSKQVAGARGNGGKFDQANEVYTNISRRRQRSFQTRGYSFGTLCILSSTRYSNDFLDRRMDEVRAQPEEFPHIQFRRWKQYEVVPQERFSGEKFRLLVGTDRYPTRVLDDDSVEGKDYPDGATVLDVPVEYKGRFITDADGALRDIVGIATDTLSAFINQRHKIVEATERFQNREDEQPYMDKAEVELATDGMPQWREDYLLSLPEDLKNAPHFIHCDLSLSGDPCGIAVARYEGHVTRRDPSTGEMEALPKAAIVAAISLQPDKENVIDIAAVRNLATQLSTFYGLNIEEITFDGFQSSDSIQTLMRAGFKSRIISMDRTTEPYVEFRRMIYDDRVDLCPADILRTELANLEYHSEKELIDHPPKGSKDCADAACGALHALRTNRTIRARSGLYERDGGGRFEKSRGARANPERPAGKKVTKRPAKKERPNPTRSA